MIWVGVRAFHGVFYISGVALLRVACFATGFGMSMWIMVMAIGQ
jgi:hypothetical protein